MHEFSWRTTSLRTRDAEDRGIRLLNPDILGEHNEGETLSQTASLGVAVSVGHEPQHIATGDGLQRRYDIRVEFDIFKSMLQIYRVKVLREIIASVTHLSERADKCRQPNLLKTDSLPSEFRTNGVSNFDHLIDC